MSSSPFGPDARRAFKQILFDPQSDVQVMGAVFLY